jgi:beta-carotene 3-hydroxylase
LTLLAGILLGFVGMEAVAWAAHRWLMHGPLWFLHRSHHRPRRGAFEANDLFGLFFSALSILALGIGVRGHAFLLGLGLGMTLFGAGYLLVHDGMVHGRFGKKPPPKNAYLRRLVRAHRIHHGSGAAEGTRNFGFLWAPRDSVRRAP